MRTFLQLTFFWLITAAALCRTTETVWESWVRPPLIGAYEQQTYKMLAGYLGYLLAKGERSNPYIKEVIK